MYADSSHKVLTEVVLDSPRKTRVLHVTLNMDIGGTEQVIKQLVLGLDENKYECGVVCVDGHVGVMGQQLAEKNIRTWALKREKGFDIALIGQLRRLAREHRFDIIHCHQYTPYVYGTLASLFTGIKVVFTEHGRFYPDSHTLKRRLVNQWLRFHTHSITAISAATRTALARHEWIPQRSIQVIYNGVLSPCSNAGNADLRAGLGIRDEHVVLGTISRLDAIKNHSMMIRAFGRVHKDHPNTRLMITGDGAERQRLEAQVKELGLEGRVLFTGFQSDPGSYLNIIDIFLLSSHSEGTSMTLIEAMAKGKPCVVTAVGGNPEVVTHETDGLLTAPDDERQFANAIQSLIADPARQTSISEAARRTFSQRFDLEAMVTAYDALYSSVLRIRPSSQ